MHKTKSKILIGFMVISIALTLTTPVIAHAAWWNPVSWFKVLIQKISPKKNAEKPKEEQNFGPKNASTSEYRVATGNDATQNNNANSNSSSSNTNNNSQNNNAGNQNNNPANSTYYDETPEYHVASSSSSQTPQPCPDTNQPMCATNGVTYRNYCELQRAGATYNYGSACVTPSTGSNSNSSSSGSTNQICTTEIEPVCATNGITYSNYCEMQRAGATYYYGSACMPSSTGSSSGSSSNTNVSSSTGSNNTTNTTTSTGSSSSVNTNTSSSSGTATTGGSGATTATFSCGLSANPSQSVNLRNRSNSYYYRPIPATVGADIKWYTNIINTGPDDMGEWKSQNVGIGTRCYSTVYYQIDLDSNNTWDVTMKGDMAQLRATDPNNVVYYAIKNSPNWKAVAGNHKWRICADGANKINETDETDNCVEGTIEVK